MRRSPQQEAASFIDLIYETATFPISAAVQTNREWIALTRALEKPEWLEDTRFKTPALRQRHINERLTMTQDAFQARTGGGVAGPADQGGRSLRSGPDPDANAV